MINNDCSDNEYNHDIVDEDIISESNEIESIVILVNTVTQTVMRILRMARLGATMCIVIMMEMNRVSRYDNI